MSDKVQVQPAGEPYPIPATYKVYMRLHRCNCVVLLIEYRLDKEVRYYLGNPDGQIIKRCPECKQVIKLNELKKVGRHQWVLSIG